MRCRSLTGLPVLTAILCVAVPPAARGGVSMGIVRVSNGAGNGDPYEPEFNSATHHTFDLLVHIFNDDDWCAAGLEAELSLGTFFQATQNGYGPPPPEIVEMSPAAAFDTYYTSVGAQPSFCPTSPQETPTSLFAEWYDTVDTGDGTFPLVRAPIILPHPLVGTHVTPRIGAQVGTLDMVIGVGSTGGEIFPFSFDVYAICRGDLNEARSILDRAGKKQKGD